MIAVNYRRTIDSMGIANIITNIQRILGMNWPIGYLARHLIENESDIEVMIKELNIRSLISPTYISVLNLVDHSKSYIITRDANPSDISNSIRNHTLVQTNCDHDKLVPNIMYSLERIELFKSLDNICNRDNILPNIIQFPIKNNSTIYYWYYISGDKTTNCFKV